MVTYLSGVKFCDQMLELLSLQDYVTTHNVSDNLIAEQIFPKVASVLSCTR